MKKIIEADINVCDDFTNGPDRLRVEIDIPLAQRIIRLSELVKENHLYKVCEFSYLPEILVADYDDAGRCIYRPPQTDDELEKCSVECVMLTVKEGSFFWKGLIKHTDTNWNHESIPLSELDELLLGGPANAENRKKDCDKRCENDPGAMEDYHCLHCPGRNLDAAPRPL